MVQKIHVDGYKWVKKLSKFSKSFIKKYTQNSDSVYFLEVDVEYPKNLCNYHKEFLFLPEKKKNRKGRKACF